MREKFKLKYIAGSILFILLFVSGVISCMASELEPIVSSDESYYYKNEDNGNHILFDDKAGLLTEDELDQLFDNMYDISEYGHVGFVTTTKDDFWNVEAYADNYYHQVFHNESGTIFLIDMDKRKICIFSDGAIYNTITSDYADTITDNVYTYASDGDYYECASAAFHQILTVLEGGKIAQPMKYICNFLLAVISAILLIYFYVRATSSPSEASDRQLMEGITSHCNFTNVKKKQVGESRRYSPRTSGGGGSSGGGGGGGGGGGSHSF